MWQNPAAATSAKDNLSAPRHLNQCFQQMTTKQPTFFGSPSDTAIQHHQSQQRIAQLELALVHEIDDACMQTEAPPDAHLFSQQ